MKKLTKEILQERSNVIHNNKYLIIGEYKNNSTKIKIKHLECDEEFEQQPGNHLQGKGCNICFSIKRSNQLELQEKSNKLYNGEYLILGDYINNQTKILIKHLVCNTEFKCISNNHINGKGGCPNCFKKIKKTKEQLQDESNKIHNNEYVILGKYINSDTKIEIMHKICNNIFLQTPDKHLRNNKCPKCYGKNKLTKEILQERSNKLYNNEYTILGDYINNSTHILIKHNICGSEYMQIPNNHLRDRTCFNCNDGISKGEKIIKNFLDSNKINYVYNRKIEGCKLKNSLRFDFYLPDTNSGIEYDGEQHFRPIEYFGGEKNFKLIKKRDNIKNNFCSDNNINLYRISFKENIEDKLKEIFNI